MRSCRRLSFICALGLIAWSTNTQARSLTMEQAVALAVKNSKAVAKAEQQLVELEATRKSTRGAFLPKLKVSANVFVWDDVIPFDLSDLGLLLETLWNQHPDLGQLPAMEMGNIRDRVTSQVTVTIAQPLTPLWQIAEGYSAIKYGQRAAKKAVNKSRLDVAADARRAYIQLRQAQAGVGIAKDAVKQVEAQLKVVRAFHKAGLMGKNDVLKVEVGLARAKGAVVQTQAGEELAQAALAITLGLSSDEALVAAQSFGEPSAGGPRFGAYLAKAYKQRPMLGAVKDQQAAAKAQTRAAKAGLIPQIVAVANYQRTDGQGFGVQKNVFFAGGTLNWSFDWGSDYYKIDAAKSKVRRAELDEKLLRDGIFLQVKQAYLALRTAYQQLTIAKVAVKQAEEAYRIEKSKYEQSSATTTDLLNAQLALNRARLTENNARYGWHIARSELRRVTGAPIDDKTRNSKEVN